MQNAMRIAMMGGKRLPYDAEVEYLQGDGVARIMLDDSYSPEKK